MSKNMLSIIKQAVPILEMAGIDLDTILESALNTLPVYFQQKIDIYKAKYPDLNIVIMITTRENTETKLQEFWLVPVGVKEIKIVEQFEPINLSELLGSFTITQLLDNPELLTDKL